MKPLLAIVQCATPRRIWEFAWHVLPWLTHSLAPLWHSYNDLCPQQITSTSKHTPAAQRAVEGCSIHSFGYLQHWSAFFPGPWCFATNPKFPLSLLPWCSSHRPALLVILSCSSLSHSCSDKFSPGYNSCCRAPPRLWSWLLGWMWAHLAPMPQTLPLHP